MSGTLDGPDASSLKPVSSLRSRFENLAKDPHGPDTTTNVGSKAPRPLSQARPLSLRPGSSFEIREPANVGGDHEHARERITSLNASSPKLRPRSMIATSPFRIIAPPARPGLSRSPDTVAASPVDFHLVGKSSATLPSVDFHAPSPSPVISFPRTLNHAATLGSQSSPNEHPHSRNLQQTDLNVSASPVSLADGSGQPQSKRVAPPVNRTVKPKVPSKPSSLAQKLGELPALTPPVEPLNKSPSPFVTPPGTRSATPDDVVSAWPRSRNSSDASFVQRLRGDSDASFVERVRATSDLSSPRISRGVSDGSLRRRVRAGSADSFVEASSFQEHHAPSMRGGQPINGSQRPGAIPARQGPRIRNDMKDAGDSPADSPRAAPRPESQKPSGKRSSIKVLSGRTSPLKRELWRRGSGEGMAVGQRAEAAPQRIPRTTLATPVVAQAVTRSTPSPPSLAPAVPAPRRSVDRRREPPGPVEPSADPRGSRVVEPSPVEVDGATTPRFAEHSEYPDSSQSSRKPPTFRQHPWRIFAEHDAKVFAVCGDVVCTTGHSTKAWSLRTGKQILDYPHNEIVKVTSLVFKPSTSVEDEGKRVWLGTNVGEIHELDIPSGSVVKTRSNCHMRKEIIRMYRYASELWTLDDAGDLNAWKADHRGMLSLDSQYNRFRTPRGHTFSIALGPHLWIAIGKDIRVYAPSARSEGEFSVLWHALSQAGTGEVRSGATLSAKPDLVYFGHQDGKVSIYNRKDFSCQAVVNVSVYKLSSLAGVGDRLWAGFHTGMAYVYDTSTTPWRVVKDWKAHEKQILGFNAEPSALWKLGRLQVVSLGADNMLKIWDGLLEDDWLGSRMLDHSDKYCTFDDLSAMVLTWNAGASKPQTLMQNRGDGNFFRQFLLNSRESPDIFVFGFQELVDLEDQKVTVKSFFKSKKKDTNELEHMSRQYRAWRDHLTACIDDMMPKSNSYLLLHTASLVGLFTCIFVKTSLRGRISHVHAADVKRGMGGYHGNKGALIVRMLIDDSSLCFINCHLAAGQTQTMHRNNDIASIFESEVLPAHPLGDHGDSAAPHSDVFAAGGDGSNILDHEICILNGDLNYRIDTMSRETVVKHIKSHNLPRLLERDQLLLSRKKNPGFRLRAFHESPITFAPTYKYNVGSDDYDTSEKRRTPAWCDRILYRGPGKVQMEDYRRWELKASDHRPVSGRLTVRVKRVDGAKRARVEGMVGDEFAAMRLRVAQSVQ